MCIPTVLNSADVPSRHDALSFNVPVTLLFVISTVLCDVACNIIKYYAMPIILTKLPVSPVGSRYSTVKVLQGIDHFSIGLYN